MIADVLIVSKTHMASASCVGGMVLSNNRYVRLLNPGNRNQPADTEFEIGDVWEIDFFSRNPLHPPHIEDVIIRNKSFKRRIDDISGLISGQNTIDWRGSADNLFDGHLNWTSNGTGYIPHDSTMPDKSVGFWIADRDLRCTTYKDNVHFGYQEGIVTRKIKFVGFQERVPIIRAGTIIRVSLSRLFPQENAGIDVPRGYYLQLSGWYGQEIQRVPVINIDDDLPF